MGNSGVSTDGESDNHETNEVELAEMLGVFRNGWGRPIWLKTGWRRGWDLNPRSLSGQRFSRPSESATLAPLRNKFIRMELVRPREVAEKIVVTDDGSLLPKFRTER